MQLVFLENIWFHCVGDFFFFMFLTTWEVFWKNSWLFDDLENFIWWFVMGGFVKGSWGGVGIFHVAFSQRNMLFSTINASCLSSVFCRLPFFSQQYAIYIFHRKSDAKRCHHMEYDIYLIRLLGGCKRTVDANKCWGYAAVKQDIEIYLHSCKPIKNYRVAKLQSTQWIFELSIQMDLC